MTSDQLQEELGALLGRCVNVIRELETENAELKARREWKGLTDEEIRGLWEFPQELSWIESIHAAIRKAEAALREKNGG